MTANSETENLKFTFTFSSIALPYFLLINTPKNRFIKKKNCGILNKAF